MPKKSINSDSNGPLPEEKSGRHRTAAEKLAEKKEPEEKRSDSDRSRTWACIIYPDSAPANFREIISDSLVACFLSPLHTDPGEDEKTERKPHHHLVARYETVKYKEQFQEFTKLFGGVGAERIHDFRTYSRYLCHLDQPNKKRYDPSDVLSFGGLDYRDVILSASELDEELDRVVCEIIEFCTENENLIKNSFSRLLRYAIRERKDWFRHLRKDCAYIIKEYLKSAEWDSRKGMPQLVYISGKLTDPLTGEICPRQVGKGEADANNSDE